MNVDEVITGVCVTWNTKELIERAYNSIRQFHLKMKIIVIDGSTSGDFCYLYLDSLKSQDLYFQVVHTNYNIGHGRGMNLGMKMVQTPFCLFFDSDIIMVKSPLEEMLKLMENDSFGVGYTEKVGYDGFDYGVHPHHLKEPGIKYLHPYFQLVQVKEFYKYKPYVHHGAPCISTMYDIHKRGISDKVLKEFPGLGHVGKDGISWKACDGEYVIHDVNYRGGTGRMRVAMGLPHIEGKWEKNYR
jgi:GT2 family glycosyltransferase